MSILIYHLEYRSASNERDMGKYIGSEALMKYSHCVNEIHIQWTLLEMHNV